MWRKSAKSDLLKSISNHRGAKTLSTRRGCSSRWVEMLSTTDALTVSKTSGTVGQLSYVVVKLADRPSSFVSLALHRWWHVAPLAVAKHWWTKMVSLRTTVAVVVIAAFVIKGRYVTLVFSADDMPMTCHWRADAGCWRHYCSQSQPWLSLSSIRSLLLLWPLQQRSKHLVVGHRANIIPIVLSVLLHRGPVRRWRRQMVFWTHGM